MKAVAPKEAEAPVREKLLRAAIELFTTRGYAATSVREIVEAAGVTKPALYYHFANKGGIYLAILQDIQALLEKEIATCQVAAEAVRNQRNQRNQIEGFLLGLFDLFERNKAGARFLNATFWGPTQGSPPFEFDCIHHRLMEVVTDLVKKGIASGELRRSAEPDQVAFILIGILSFSMDLTLAHPELDHGKAGLRRVLDLVFKGVAAPAPNHRETAQ